MEEVHCQNCEDKDGPEQDEACIEQVARGDRKDIDQPLDLREDLEVLPSKSVQAEESKHSRIDFVDVDHLAQFVIPLGRQEEDVEPVLALTEELGGAQSGEFGEHFQSVGPLEDEPFPDEELLESRFLVGMVQQLAERVQDDHNSEAFLELFRSDDVEQEAANPLEAACFVAFLLRPLLNNLGICQCELPCHSDPFLLPSLEVGSSQFLLHLLAEGVHYRGHEQLEDIEGHE
mmetsp:Transcript_32821/g.50133  ORF Transcript_32821/g.50133 Transcript_32821/m.50133 type:complete len:232 (+) Transcript_32821:961-1656(+)